MARVNSSLKTKLHDLQIFVFLFTAIPVAIIGLLLADELSAASQRRDQAQAAVAVNNIIDSIHDLQFALAVDYLSTYTGYGYVDEVEEPLLSQIVANQSAVRVAYSNVLAALETLQPQHREPLKTDTVDQYYEIVEARLRARHDAFWYVTATSYDFKMRMMALESAYSRYDERAGVIEQDLGSSASERELRGRTATNLMRDLIFVAGQLRGTLAVSYDFGLPAIPHMIRLKNQLWLMTNYTMYQSGLIGEQIASRDHLSSHLVSIVKTSDGKRSLAWSQVKELMGSPFLVPALISDRDRSDQLGAIDVSVMEEFGLTLSRIFRLSAERELPDDVVDYPFTGLQWTGRVQEATEPVNAMALRAKTMGQDLTQKALSQAIDDYETELTLLGLVSIGGLTIWFFVFLSFRSIKELPRSRW